MNFNFHRLPRINYILWTPQYLKIDERINNIKYNLINKIIENWFVCFFLKILTLLF